MTFTRAKNLGLALLSLSCIGTVVFLFVSIQDLAGHVNEIAEDLIGTRQKVDDFADSIEASQVLFRRYRQRGRVSPGHVEAPLDRMPRVFEQLREVETGVALPLDDLSAQLDRARAAFANYVAQDNREPQGAAATTALQAATRSVGALRDSLRTLATAVSPEHRTRARPLLKQVSDLIALTEKNLAAYAAQDRIQMREVLLPLDWASTALSQLTPKVGMAFRSQISELVGFVSHLRGVLVSYEDDEAFTATGGNTETIKRLGAEADTLTERISSAKTALATDLLAHVEQIRVRALDGAARAKRGALVAAAFMGFFAFGMAGFLGRVLARHVRTLEEGTRKLSAGHYEHRLPISGTDDLGRLAAAFNRMAGDLQEKTEEITQLAAAVQQAPDGVAICDPEGQVLYANPAFWKLIQDNSEHPDHLKLPSLYPATEGPNSWATHFEGALNGSPWSGRLTAMSRDGKGYQEFCSLAPIRDTRGGISRVLVRKRDVTREVQLEDRVRDSQKLQALGTLAGGIAHDFNNLMSPIMGYSEMLLHQARPESKEQMRLERILSAATKASSLVQQIVMFSRPGDKTKRPLQLAALTKECLKLFEISLPSDLHIQRHIAPELPEVLADPTQMHQVLMNLLTNAKHAMGDHPGQLVCRLESCTSPDVQLPANSGLQGPCVCLSLEDEGYGMAPEVQERIFEPFFSTKGLGEGTGMGLAVVRGIVEDHGGAITVESQLQRGSTFRIFLPVTTAPALETPEELSLETVTGAERVLLVEGQEGIREALCEALGLLGYHVEGVPDAARALERVSRTQEPWDAIILDAKELGVPGRDLAGELRQAAAELRILVCCNRTNGQEDDCIEAAGIDGWIEKPFSPMTIGAALRRVYAPPSGLFAAQA